MITSSSILSDLPSRPDNPSSSATKRIRILRRFAAPFAAPFPCCPPDGPRDGEAKALITKEAILAGLKSS